jgi:hypothetical protein
MCGKDSIITIIHHGSFGSYHSNGFIMRSHRISPTCCGDNARVLHSQANPSAPQEIQACKSPTGDREQSRACRWKPGWRTSQHDRAGYVLRGLAFGPQVCRNRISKLLLLDGFGTMQLTSID